MPEYACEPPQWPPPTSSDKYIIDTFTCVSALMRDGYSLGFSGGYGYGPLVSCCGFLAEKSGGSPISFYLSIICLVYCVFLTMVFTVWSLKQQNTAVARRLVPSRLPPHGVTATIASAV